ncbi:MAG: hypothetical protein M2R45_00960 [Verrucomicrobia subdivision 3 bacterium]|nr:hypothetical protein [Limisphaerales bacterium]MCS1414628.1 hypothetical protein [Limisphaerales bacterium]
MGRSTYVHRKQRISQHTEFLKKHPEYSLQKDTILLLPEQPASGHLVNTAQASPPSLQMPTKA